MLHFESHPIMTRESRFSRALPHHTFPAFLNPNGRKTLYWDIPQFSLENFY